MGSKSIPEELVELWKEEEALERWAQEEQRW